MKKHVVELIRRGMMAAWGGPVILAIIYACLGSNGVVETLTVKEVCMGILSSAVMAFIAAGIPVVYQVEQLPLPMAILIHCGVLYLDCILVYLINGWLPGQRKHILIFTGIFLVCYAIIWLIIYCIEKSKAKKLNKMLKG